MSPIEDTFSKAKCVMKAMEAEMQVLHDIDTIVYMAHFPPLLPVTVKEG